MSDPNYISVIDLSELFIVFGAHRLIGFPKEEEFFTPRVAEENDVDYTIGIDGHVSVEKMAHAGSRDVVEVDIKLESGSPSNTFLWAQRTFQKSVPGIPWVPFMVKHRASRMLSPQACILKRPPRIGGRGGRGAPTSTWTFLLVGVTGLLSGVELLPPNA